MNTRRKTSWRRLAVGSFLFWLFTVAATRPAGAYVLSGQHWPEDAPIVMKLELGTQIVELTDGSSSWDEVAKAALGIWNPYLGGGVQFVGEISTAEPGHNDGMNEVFFDNTIYGEDFGDDTLAITLSTYNTSTNIKSEADVIVNSTKPFNSYRGKLEQTKNGATVFDLRRILTHEFGHVLGLNHVPQSAVSIMTPEVTDIDTIQADDIAGVAAIYGSSSPDAPVITGGNPSASGVDGQPFTYRIDATNDPASFQASGLPDGLALNTLNGIIGGTPTTQGTYRVSIGATNAAGTGTATLTLTFAPVPVITGSFTATAYVGQPFYYRIHASGTPTSYASAGTLGEFTVNPATGLLSGTPTTAGVLNIGLSATNAVATGNAALTLTVETDATLKTLHSLGASNIEGQTILALVKGGDGNLYGVTTGGGPAQAGTFFRCAPDGTFTVLHDFAGDGGPQQPLSLLPAADGNFYGTSKYGGVYDLGTVFKVTTDGMVTVVGSFNPPNESAPVESSVLLAKDGNYYGAWTFLQGSDSESGFDGSIFKLTPGGILTILHQFSGGGDGMSPNALIQASGGNFYGTTAGGLDTASTIFRITPDGGFATLHTFTASDGKNTTAALLQTRDGSFYGTAGQTGIGYGTIFKFAPGVAFTVLRTFTMNDGDTLTGLTQGIDGNLYGVESGGEAAYYTGASVFKTTPGGALSILHAASGQEGTGPFLPLIANADDTFYFGSVDAIFKETPGATPPVPPAVTLAATTPKVTAGSGDTGVFTLTLASPQGQAITVYYTVKGSAANGTDYVLLNGKKKIKPGKTSKPINVVPLGDLGGETRKAVKIVLQPDPNYTVGTPLPAKVKIFAPIGGTAERPPNGAPSR